MINVIRDEKLIENCNEQSPRVFSYREELLSHPTVADVRGWGLMMVLELVADKNTMAFFDRSVDAQSLFQSMALKHGLVMYRSLYGSSRQPPLARGLPIWISPPLFHQLRRSRRDDAAVAGDALRVGEPGPVAVGRRRAQAEVAPAGSGARVGRLCGKGSQR